MKKLIISGLLIAIGITAIATKPSILTLNEKSAIPKAGLFQPERFELDTKNMIDNWYLEQYIAIDKPVTGNLLVDTTTTTIIDRLQRLPRVIPMTYNSLVKEQILKYARMNESVPRFLAMGTYYMPIFEAALDRHDLPLELKYLPIVESALDPIIKSRAGARGLWQFMEGTAKQYNLEVNSLIDERCDPIASSEAAAKHLKRLYEKFGDWHLVLAAYNYGEGNIIKAMNRAGKNKGYWDIINYLPAETRNYVPAFIAVNYIMNYYDKHNISAALTRRPMAVDTVHVNRRVHFEQISEVMDIPIDELRILNPQYITNLIPGNIHTYTLTLPTLQAYCYVANEDSITNHNAEKYALQTVVEPAVLNSSAKDTREYVMETVYKYHTVKKGETLASIAKKYGVTQSAIRSANKMGKKAGVKRNQKLTIPVQQRRYIDAPKQDEATIDSSGGDDSAAATDNKPQESTADKSSTASAIKEQNTDTTNTASNTKAKVETKAETKPKADKKAETKPKTVTHTVKSGENLYKIATKYGTTVDELKKANNLKSDDLQVGKVLTIPQKATSKSSSKSSSKSKSGSKKSSKKKSSKKKK